MRICALDLGICILAHFPGDAEKWGGWGNAGLDDVETSVHQGREKPCYSLHSCLPLGLMIPVSNSTLNIALPDSYQCPSIRGTDYRLPLPSAPPPFTYSEDKREGPSGNRKRCPSPSAWTHGVAHAGSNLTTSTWKWGIFCSVHYFRDSNGNWTFIQSN